MELSISASRSLKYLSLVLTPVNIVQLEPDHNGMVNYVEYINMVRSRVCWYVRTPVSSLFRRHIKMHENNYRETCCFGQKLSPYLPHVSGSQRPTEHPRPLRNLHR